MISKSQFLDINNSWYQRWIMKWSSTLVKIANATPDILEGAQLYSDLNKKSNFT